MSFGQPTEMYSLEGTEFLRREIEHCKQAIDYNLIVDEIDQDMK